MSSSTQDRKRKLDELWADLNADDKGEPASSEERFHASGAAAEKGTTPPPAAKPRRYISVTRTYEFAGDTVTETRDVPEDSDEARAYLAAQEALKAKENGASREDGGTRVECESSSPTTDNVKAEDDTKSVCTRSVLKDGMNALGSPSTTSASAPESVGPSQSTSSPHPPSSPPSSGQKQKPQSKLQAAVASRKKPPPKRVSSNLDKLAASLMGKPTKINTLDKSKMDWNKYVDREGIVDELRYHNKNGFVEKQEFLGRTYQRQEEEYKAMRKEASRRK